MDSFLGIGGPEFLLILILALVFLGPLRMLQVARGAGRLMRDLQRYYKTLMADFHQELASLDPAQEPSRKDEMKDEMKDDPTPQSPPVSTQPKTGS